MHRPPSCSLQVRLLPEVCRPAYVVRHRGVTLLAVDPRSTRLEVAGWFAEHLSEAERVAYRRGYGRPLGDPPDLHVIGDLPVPMLVPESLRLPQLGVPYSHESRVVGRALTGASGTKE